MKKLLKGFFLQMFAEGEAGSESAGAAGQQEAVVVYGKPEGEGAKTAGEENPGTPSATEEESFEDLIKGKYKDDFEKRVRGILNDRMRGTKEKESGYAAMAPVMRMLAAKYGQNPDAIDYVKLSQAVKADDAFFESAALERGITAGEFRSNMEVASLKEQLEKNERETRGRAAFEQMKREGEALKEFYPNFSLETEMRNPDFVRMMRAGLRLRDAYEVVHRNEINSQMMHYAAKKAQEQVSKSVQANQNRPEENGTESVPAVVYKDDPAKLTKADRKAIKERARRGERISF